MSEDKGKLNFIWAAFWGGLLFCFQGCFSFKFVVKAAMFSLICIDLIVKSPFVVHVRLSKDMNQLHRYETEKLNRAKLSRRTRRDRYPLLFTPQLSLLYN